MISDLDAPPATDAAPTTAALGEAFAAALGATLGSVPMGAGEPVGVPVELDLPFAVVAPLEGALTGDVAVFLDDPTARTLVTTPAGEIDLGDALVPVLHAAASVLDGVTIGRPTSVDPRVAHSRLESRPGGALAAVGSEAVLCAALGVALDPPAVPADAPAPVAAAAAAPTAAPTTRADGPARPAGERLDLLRGVVMDATVELGRAHMTIDDLLSLHDGAVIELDRLAGDPADLVVNGRLIARGEVVVVDENYALRITEIVTGDGR